MRQLTLSLILVVVTAVVGLGWGMDQWYNNQQAHTENPAIKACKLLGKDLMQLIASGGLNTAQLESWAEQSNFQIQIIPYVDFPIPAGLKPSFEGGEPLVLESGSVISLHYYYAPEQMVVSINLPSSTYSKKDVRLSWILTLSFYAGVIAILAIWLYPLLKRLLLLQRKASAFGAGDLTARIPPGLSYIADIEQEFNRMAQRIESLVYDNKLLSRGLSHDLRTPIARLRFGLDVLQEADLSEAQQKTMAHLNRDLIAMESLVETLLSYARMDQAQVSILPKSLDLAEWLQEIVRDFYADHVTLDFSGITAPPHILADPEYLNMLVHNLLQNAERHGKGKILVRLRTTDKKINLIVEDNGPGIPLEERDHVLKPFYRIASAQNTQGHGLGLAIVERIAQWHKAEVVLGESAELGGLRVDVVFVRIGSA